ncbi:alpha/beta hydrolase fold domain-containing protein [Coralliovum pocilloporae]|uniref:alpha/beta hydrolase fold domain-containing protein n=1 Tax=Coralliovum pocilloporae TaxID=3066369 RepID=UPI003306E8AD
MYTATEVDGIALQHAVDMVDLVEVVVRCHRLGTQGPDGQLHIYPGFGGDRTAPSYEEHAHAPMLTREDCEYYFRIYGESEFERFEASPEFAPLYQPDFSIFPRAAVFTADIDPLRDDGSQFAERLHEAGIPCRLRNDAELVHGYVRARHMSHRVKTALDEVCASVDWLLGSEPV